MTLKYYPVSKAVQTSPSDEITQSYKAMVGDYFEKAPNVETVSWNGIDRIARVTSKSAETNFYRDRDRYRKVIFKDFDFEPKLGDIGEFQGYKWLCIQTDNLSVGLNACTVEQVNNSLKFYESSILKEIPCVVTNRVTLDLKENRYMELPSGTVMVVCQDNADSLLIKEGQRIPLGRNLYEVDGIDDISNPGLLNIKMSKTQNQNNNAPSSVSSGGGW